MQEISHIQKIFVDSRRSRPGSAGVAPPWESTIQLARRARVEAHTALPGEGATQAPLTVSKVERIALKEGVGYSG